MEQVVPPQERGRSAPETRAARVVVLAADLIWGTRLEALVRGAGARPVRARDLRQLAELLAGADPVDGVVVDTTSRAYDGVAAVALAAGDGRAVLAAAQHDDVDLRRRALEAGATKVLPYARLHADGAALIGAWLTGRAAAGPRR